MLNIMHADKSIILKDIENIKAKGKIEVKISNALALDKTVIFFILSSFFTNSIVFKCSLSLFAAIADNIAAIT